MRTYLKPVVEDLMRHYRSEEQSIPAVGLFGNTRITEVIKHLNGALQEATKTKGNWPVSKDFGALILAPATLSGVTTTTGSRQIPLTAAQGFLDYMVGCTVRFTGENVDNEIMQYDPVAEVATLKDPIMVGATIDATVWHDSIRIDPECSEVMRPVFIEEVGELVPLGGPAPALYRGSDYNYFDDFHFHSRTFPGRSFPLAKTEAPGTPVYYWVDVEYNYGWAYRLRLRVIPVPNTSGILMYRGRLKNRHTVSEVLNFPKGPVSLVVSGGIGTMTLLEDPTGWTNIGVIDSEGTFAAGNFTVTGTPGGNVVTFTAAGVPNGAYAEVYYENNKVPAEPTAIRFPDDLIESVLIPYTEQRMTGGAYFRNKEAKPEIARQHNVAGQILRDSNPQEHSPMRIRPLF